MYRILLSLTIFILVTQITVSQIYTNVAKPFSEKLQLNLNLDTIPEIEIMRPHPELLKKLVGASYAKNINMEIDFNQESHSVFKNKNKELRILKLKAEGAKSLNLSFKDFVLSQNSSLFIYTKNKKIIMGPITNINNQVFYNTHLIMSNEVILELYSDIGSYNNIFIEKIGYGIKDVSYFADETSKLKSEKESKSLSIQSNCSTYTQQDFDNFIAGTKDECGHLAQYAYGSNTGLKEANCSDFDDFEKNKRSSAIIVSYNCDDEEWEYYNGTLINTADVNATNYCNSYLLTCRHCITGTIGWSEGIAPTHVAVRFNWIRNVCDISNFPNCIGNKQAWKDAINLNDVVDYTDVSYVMGELNGDEGGQSPEYAILKINTPLRLKEYYSGWRLLEEVIIPYEMISYYLGRTGVSPTIMRQQELKVFDYGYEDFIHTKAIQPYTGDLVNGNSGGIVLDENGYALGLNCGGKVGASFGMLFFDYAWSSTNKPRTILDPNGILATQISNKAEILVEGAERWEKGDCFTSTYECASTFNIEDFISPASNIDGLCCFKLDFIDPNANFTGGKPQGLRVYRNTDRQETLFHTFGQPVFPDDEENYIDPQNGYLVEFCIESDKLDEDNNTIIFEFLDNNGNIICRKEVEVYCTDPCEETTCSEDFENWLTITADENSLECDEDECLVTLDFEIPEEFGCFTHLSFETTLNGEILDPNTMIIDASTFDLSNYTKCIEKGKTYEVTIKLYKGIEDTEPCIITKSTYCTIADLHPPCIPDCPLVPWERQPDLQFTTTTCPECEINITYYSREACDKYDIQITGIEKHNTNPNNPNACNLCDEVDTYREAVQAIINENYMKFPFPKLFSEPCLSTFRVSKSSCWEVWDMSQHGPNEEVVIKWVITIPCNSDCCLREVEICKLPNGDYTMEDLGSTSTANNCGSVPAGTNSEQQWCHYTCNYLQNINTTFKQVSNTDSGIFEIIKENRNNPDVIYSMINAKNNNEYLNISIKETNGKNVLIRILDMKGVVINELQSDLNLNNNNFNIGLDKLVSGAYLYTIEIDGIIVKSNNLVITK